MINHLEAEQGGNFHSNEARLGPEEIWRFGLFITLFAIYPLNALRAQLRTVIFNFYFFNEKQLSLRWILFFL